MKQCKIESIGVKYPEKVVLTSEILERLKLKNPPKLELLTGIRERRVCSNGEDSLTLAMDAIEDCLNHSQFEAADIEMIIYSSISKYVGGITHHYEPSISLLIKHRLNISEALNFDLSNACAGMMTGASVAIDFIKRNVVKNCLVVSGEYISSISDNAEKNINTSTHQELASLTVGDAGAAVIFAQTDETHERILTLDMITLSRYSSLCTGNQNCNQPGGIMKTNMKMIHDVSIQHAPKYIETSLKNAGINWKDIDYLIPHQTSKMAIQYGRKAFLEYFGDETGEVIINLKETGNTASTTHFTTLYKYLNNKAFKEGSRIMLISFASGLVIGIMVLTLSEIINRYGEYH